MNRSKPRTSTADARHEQCIKQAMRSIERRARRPGELLKSRADAANWFRLRLGEYEHEVFAAAWLDTGYRLIAFEELFRGTLASSFVSVREILKTALARNAAAVLFAHNHPSGDTRPSNDDIAISRGISVALEMIDVRVLDHFVVTASNTPVVIDVHDAATLGRAHRPTAARPANDRANRNAGGRTAGQGRDARAAAVAPEKKATPKAGVAAEPRRRRGRAPA